MKKLRIVVLFICVLTFLSLPFTEVIAYKSEEDNSDVNLLMVPLDDRPANMYFPEQVAKTAGVNILMPPRDIIGYYTDAGDGEKVSKWILDNEDQADGFVISVSMLAYGGLIASRTGHQSHEAAMDNIQVIKEFKEKYPDKPVYVYDTIQRLAVTTSNEEYEVYYGLVREWAILKDKVENFEEFESERPRLEELESLIPEEVLDDYLQARGRNHEVNKTLIDWANEGHIDNFILAQDDAAEYGLHRAEREILVERVKDLNVENKVSVYPGADEIDVVLVGRFISKLFNPLC